MKDGRTISPADFHLKSRHAGRLPCYVHVQPATTQHHLPEITVDKKSDSPDEDKSVHGARLLIPTLKDFFVKHPLINPKVSLGDAAFDSAGIYKSLLTGDTFGEQKHFSKAYIPLNARASLENPDYSINADGIPCCPHDPSLPMKYEGTSMLRSGVTRYKFVCPKMQWVYDKSTQKCHRECCCDNPCSLFNASKSAEMLSYTLK